jgi:hypothetical protein
MPKEPKEAVFSASPDVTQYRLANHVSAVAAAGIVYLDFAQEDARIRGRVVLARVAVSSAQAANFAEQLASLAAQAPF